ncbi:MAG TPA: hypothetical protein VEC19_00525 [Usitatibacter sp.]|nr:hypothetical protein [Usitatibacter sp.]
MSLLLDALKRAEQEKLARGDRPDLQVVGHGEPAQPGPAPAAAPANLELQPIAANSGAPPSKAQTAAQAQMVFQAKAAGAAAGNTGAKRGVLYVAAAVILLAVLGAGGYVWYAMKSLAPAASPKRIVAPTPAGSPAAGAVPATPAAPEKAAAPAPSAPEAASPAATAVATAAAPPPDLSQRRERLAEEVLQQPVAPAQPPVRLERSEEKPRLPGDIAQAYQALQTGDLAAARRGYLAALASDATNVDAHLGIATLEARAGNAYAAAAAYRRSLELDPRNPTALAGLAALADASRPGAVEEQLRQDLMRQGGSPALHFALANLLASQARWSEAQAEYFEAHRLDPANPDIAHNLAVALDHLGQGRLATDFYRRALAAARTQPAQFDSGPVEKRLAELSR